jgi:DNA helicase-2/ATP-dependent DNA helicase PcrA
MKNNKLIISVAGSGKTTYLVNEALTLPKTEQVLITTYTEANEAEIRNKILEKKRYIPSNITVQTWFSFLLQHGVRPYQGSMNNLLWDNEIKGMLLSEGRSGKKMRPDGNQVVINGHPQFWGEDNFQKHYFTSNWKIYSDKISKFIVGCNKASNNAIIERLSKIYDNLFIDEVQDLAGYDLELIKLFFKSYIRVLLVGDPRQVTYLTHQSGKHKKKYSNGRVKDFLIDKCKSLLSTDSIDETTLIKSHRNNKEICNFSSKLYPEYESSEPCNCKSCRMEIIEHEGIFIIKTKEISAYLKKYKPVQLRWSKRTATDCDYPAINFGESKGLTCNRVLIYPTDKMEKWLKDHSYRFLGNNNKETVGVRAKFYVALTRARHSVAIVYDYKDDEVISDIKKYKYKIKNDGENPIYNISNKRQNI